ncbi:MAG: hypothetical protein ACD_58C00151G0002 [uncultured bacterium]|nr:MAG: hypothetical protein ACD_58C00151G0002 [uncultured bacterium]
MSLKLISSEKINRTVADSFTHPLEIEKEGIYLIEITASAKSWWQNFFALYRGSKLKLQIGEESFDQDSSKWNGNILKGLFKTNVYILPLRIGCYYLRLLAENKPHLQEIKIYQVIDKKVIYHPSSNNPAQDENGRPWYSFIFPGQLLQGFAIFAKCKDGNQHPTNLNDDDDLQLKIDDKIVNNNDKNVSFKHRYWYWCGNLLKGETKSYSIEKCFKEGYHTLELNADRSPEIDRVYFNITMPETSQLLPIIKLYKSLNGEDYNKFDGEIYNAVKYWNDEFAKQKFPPLEPLDPNLIKAIAYKESRVGNDLNAGIDVMQITRDECLKILNNSKDKPTEYEATSGNEVPINYGGEAKVEKPRDSIYWGVRWLYHKLHSHIINKGDHLEPQWISWKEAVKNYGPGTNNYADKIWNLYEKGIDPYKKNNRLWTYTTLLFVGLLITWQANSYYGVQNDFIPDLITNYVRETGQVKGVDTNLYNGMSPADFVDNLYHELETAVNIYPLNEGQNQKLFQLVIKLVPKEGPSFQEIFDKYTKELVEKTENLNQFIEVATTLHIIRENAYELADFDGDGANELVFLQNDALNKNYIKIYLVDRFYSTKYQLIDFMIFDSNFSSINSNIIFNKPLMIFNVADNPVPEILVFTDNDHNSSRLTILQYDESTENLKQIFNYSNKFYPEYVLTDHNHNGLLEINIKNQSSSLDEFFVPFKETFEYNSDKGLFELLETIK